MIERMIDYLTGGTFGPWLFRIISACFFNAVAVAAWWILSRPHGKIAVVCLALIWLAVPAVWVFFLPMLVQ